jgi:tetratricopeptide (TPR) repeat protein
VLSLPDDGSVCFDTDVLAAARWQDAVELEGLGAELLEGMQFPSCAAFETWLTGEQRHLQRAINLAQESGQRAIAAAAYRNLAGSDVLRGIYPRADRRLAEAESLGSGEATEVVEVAAIRGVSLLDRGDIDAAIAVFRHGLNADPGREHAFLPIMLSHADRAGLLAGDFPAACGHLDQALQIVQTRSWAGVTAAPLALLGHVAVATGDLVTARDLLEEALARACQVGDPCWETWAAHGLGLHAAASGNPSAALHHLADAVARSHPTRGGHLWSHVWALTDAARLGRRLGDTRHVAWQEEALATAQRCGMRALADQLQAPLHDARRGA